MGFHIVPLDEYLHAPQDNPLWRESFWLDAYDATENISLVIYAHARPSSRRGDLFVCVTGPGFGRIEHDVQDFDYTGLHKGLVATVGALRHTVVQPSKTVEFALTLPQLQLDLTFAATGPVYDYDWETWTASRHVEQFGVVSGSLATPGRKFAFNGTATRDHAWGARAKVPWRRWVWITARFPHDFGWSACIVDAETPLLLGYVRDEEFAEATLARLTLNDPGSTRTSAEMILQSSRINIQASIVSRAIMPRSGTDPTKGGSYNYYFIDVNDRRYGRGQGLLNVYTTPQHELLNGDVLSARAP